MNFKQKGSETVVKCCRKYVGNQALLFEELAISLLSIYDNRDEFQNPGNSF